MECGAIWDFGLRIWESMRHGVKGQTTKDRGQNGDLGNYGVWGTEHRVKRDGNSNAELETPGFIARNAGKARKAIGSPDLASFLAFLACLAFLALHHCLPPALLMCRKRSRKFFRMSN